MESKMAPKMDPKKDTKKEAEKQETIPLPLSFIRTYSAMRGPVAGQEGYPLAELMHQQPAYSRTEVQHLEEIPIEERANIPSHPGWDNDPDDVEGTAPSAHITPEAFLAFSRGAQRWNRDDIKDPKDVLSTQTRVRPETALPIRGDKFPHYIYQAKSQADKITGEPFTPQYEVPTSPSIVYTPPGVPDMPVKTATFLSLFSRMHPTPRAIMDMPTTSSNEHYTQSDVQRVVQANVNSALPGPEIVAAHDAYLESQLRIVAQVEEQEKEQMAIIEAQRQYIEKLETEHHILRHTYIPILHFRKQVLDKARQDAKDRAKAAADEAVKKAMEESKRRADRDERIREHMVGLVLDIRVKYDAAVMRINESLGKRMAQEEAIKRLEQDISEECLIVGKSSFEEVYDAVNQAVPKPQTSSSGGSAGTGLEIAGLTLRSPVSVFEPATTAAATAAEAPCDQVPSDDIYNASPVRYEKSPIKRNQSPKGKWVVRDGCEFDLTFAHSTACSNSMTYLGDDDEDDADRKDKDEQQKEEQGDSSRYAHEEAGESSKQGDKSS
ncbi:uncharacterized protein GGS22DRAFT_163427 [Annulohypoxylon maeteangense]|uniref:uncharacterized protein n=1 Tax=Annulohypoxylon maeteangense TaxID=1927788 RepID=UPI00200765A4|nr:uncharacterized protein GGS22DRAFT_163427 [Annulohypoxylon maeteangense]KAI0885322.1 hypothetical protein GGS22DRAFT_163427 [Annulohypoxylon maeteangense]